MENQQQVDALIEHLRTQKLNTKTAEYRWDRQSGALHLRADFDNGSVFTLCLLDQTHAGMIRDLFQDNLKARFAEESEFRDLLKLELGKRYTIIVENGFGLGVNAIQFVPVRIQVGRFAQHAHCIDLVIRIKRKRDFSVIKFYGKKSYAIFRDWLEINTDFLGPVDNSGPMPCRQSKYLSFDDRYMTDAIASAGVAPIYQNIVTCRPETGGAR
jgi:hypothetical protein